jgi:hypothetical protein
LATNTAEEIRLSLEDIKGHSNSVQVVRSELIRVREGLLQVAQQIAEKPGRHQMMSKLRAFIYHVKSRSDSILLSAAAKPISKGANGFNALFLGCWLRIVLALTGHPHQHFALARCHLLGLAALGRFEVPSLPAS